MTTTSSPDATANNATVGATTIQNITSVLAQTDTTMGSIGKKRMRIYWVKWRK